MKKLGLLLIFLFWPALICFAAGPIALDNQVILESDWTPTGEQTDAALIHVINYLTNIKANTDNEYLIDSADNILKEISEYRVQLKGIYKLNKTVIYCNFFHISDQNQDWLKTFVHVLDGGYLYWQIEYDLESGKCSDFAVNGAA
jgi:hypothetical protein